MPLAEKDGGKCYEADRGQRVQRVLSAGSRFLYVYVNKAPSKPLDPLTREFVKLMVSKDGQEVGHQGRLLPHPRVDLPRKS